MTSTPFKSRRSRFISWIRLVSLAENPRMTASWRSASSSLCFRAWKWRCLSSSISRSLRRSCAFFSQIILSLRCMECLRLVGSLKFYVSFAEYRLFHKALLQERPIILRSLIVLATPYLFEELFGCGQSGEGYDKIRTAPQSPHDDDCFYYHSWRNNVVIAFGTLSSFLT